MPHAELINQSPFSFELLFLADERGMPMCVPLVQATFKLDPLGSLKLIDPAPAVQVAGAWWGDPACSSMRVEPQIAFMKPATDIVLIGHAYPSNAERTEGLVGIRVGAFQKLARVFGRRRLVKRLGIYSVTPPAPFERIPLTYENAFGGWDRRHPEPNAHSFDPRNPVGIGYRSLDHGDAEDVPMPHLEDPNHLYKRPGELPPPVGFGFVAPDWQPRARFAGTYDKTWNDSCKPLLPKDFDRRFFNSASSGLVASGYLGGDESVVVLGASTTGRIEFALPGIPAPVCRVRLARGSPAELQTVLDTLVVDVDEKTVKITWRASLEVPRGAHDVVAIELPPQPLDVEDDD